MTAKHWAIFVDNDSHKSELIRSILKSTPPSLLHAFKDLKGALYSKLAIERLIDKEDRHGSKIITVHSEQSLRTMSSGEQKKALLNHLLQNNPDFIILDNPFDNLDIASQEGLKHTLKQKSTEILFILLISRRVDALPFIEDYAKLNESQLIVLKDSTAISGRIKHIAHSGKIPEPLQQITSNGDALVELRDVGVRYEDKIVLRNIDWTIKKGEFWQLIGKNGSGKTTLLSMVTGENPKGYGQDLFLFGRRKGSGESIWDIKQKIGYFTPAMTDKFTGYHSVENMLISGLNDSIGLYIKPTEAQLRLAKEWLLFIDMWHIRYKRFHDLSMGHKRLVMTVRAVVKHPPLLILDEPTAGLDDASAALLISLVNKIARESDITTIFVSHRAEPGLKPDKIYELRLTENGSVGVVK